MAASDGRLGFQIGFSLISVSFLLAQDRNAEQPLGVILSAPEGQLLRSGVELALPAKSGDLLFLGDTLLTGPRAVELLDCAARVRVSLAPASRARFERGQLRIGAGSVTATTPEPDCVLPAMPRTPNAAELHYGASLTRALRPAPPPGSLASYVAALPQAQRDALAAELPSESADPVIQMRRAGILEKYQLRAGAAQEYRKLAREWPDAVWVQSRLFVLESERDPVTPGSVSGPGKTYALLVGISQYQSGQIRPLRYAHLDALAFRDYLLSPRGGALPSSDIVVLTDEKATTAAVRNAVDTFIKVRAGPNDTVVLFLAAHGAAEPGRGAYIVTYDSDPQDLSSTALPMAGIQKLLSQDLSHVGRVLAYVDACRSGTIGSIASRTSSVNGTLERLGESDGELFLFTASRAKEVSYEGPQYGGGHGAFTYFLLSAFNGDADRNSDGNVTMNEVIDFVRAKVAEGTSDRQHPRDLGTLETNVRMADVKQEGIRLLPWTGSSQDSEPPGTTPVEVATRAVGDSTPIAEGSDFDEALDAGRLLPTEPRNAIAALQGLREKMGAREYLLQENRLRVALEDRGQQVILRYLTGDQHPQGRAAFATGAAYFQAAQTLTPESLLIESRASFALGRVRLFDKAYQEGAALLQRAARLDPSAAYTLNALGIAYLEQADYVRARAALRDATRLAPYWAYPVHNLALVESEMGDNDAAIRLYRQALKLAPQASYLPYNLGLVYQRTNRIKDAEAAFRRAIQLTPEMAEPFNALGSLKASAGRTAESEQLFRQALERDPNLLAARHNLALLYAQSGRMPQAFDLWRENLAASPAYLPSHLSLARALAAQGRSADAVKQYQAIVELKPDYVAARLAMAQIHAQGGDPALALQQVREAVKLQPHNPLLYEQIGDLETAGGRREDAVAAFQAALERTADSGTRKRLRKKLGR